jgi:hypothetical protein
MMTQPTAEPEIDFEKAAQNLITIINSEYNGEGDSWINASDLPEISGFLRSFADRVRSNHDAETRAAAIKECARICEATAENLSWEIEPGYTGNDWLRAQKENAEKLAKQIRSLSKPNQ